VLDPSLARHGLGGDGARVYWDSVAASISSHPQVESLALATPPPLGSAVHQVTHGTDAGPLAIMVMRVEAAFFSALHIPFVAGRTFARHDDPSAVIISRRLALTMYGTIDVVGRRYPRTNPTRTIVGVTADATVSRVRVSGTAEEYRPLRPADYGDAALVVRTRTAPRQLLAPLRDAARAADPRIQPATRLLARDYDRHLRGPRLASAISAMIAAVVLTLACLGIFGVVAYAVRLRTREIGIRRALGADAPRVFSALVSQLFWPVGVGMLMGTAAGSGASRLLAGEPFHIAVSDAVPPVAALLIFAIAALAAAVLPASRAMRDDPVQALRHE
jgi:hypothetical protein